MYQTLLSSSSVAGIAIGALAGGSLIAGGRKRMVILFNFVALVGVVLSLINNFTLMCVGRLIFGFASGVFVVAGSKMLDETIPAHLMDHGYGASTNLAINVFIMVSMLMGLGMPDS